MCNSLFDEFNPIKVKQWKQKIQFDLKGEDFNTLLTKTDEDIVIKPFYHQENTEEFTIPLSQNDFSICQSIFISDEKIASFLAKDAIKRGAKAILFEANKPFDIPLLIHDVAIFKGIEIYFKLHFLSQDFIEKLIQNTIGIKIHLNLDSIGNLARTGNWFYSKQKDAKILESTLRNLQFKGSVLSVDVSLYQNSGANSVQQIAYALAHGNEYLNDINSNILETSGGNYLQEFEIVFNFSVGSNYFFEIAKLRAFRVLWQLLQKEYKFHVFPKVFAVPSSRNKTLYDYNVNMLRTTTECMSAILGGADTISNRAYDSVYHKKNEFGERIARNQLLILQEESFFNNNADNKVNHFADGSYYIEALTKEIAEKALVIFKSIEKSGGFLKQLKEGTIQRKIEENAKKEQLKFTRGTKILVGINKYINPKDSMKDTIEIYPFVKINPRETIVKPIIPKRLAEKDEQERLKKE